ncbi:trans-sulfuration enzyme family protein [Tessaracoccus oleiagri]|uniref:homocysteine desulfhydrase n=1 Tax=Tessaracoccus oleiagri TaxID=686624 RepID=A0A1G9I032_9ACTN|nr:PLP-dependent transferase [Tessaracoccus oleiagri]SDL18597.1 cystathionine gamma-synthase [Tessaracoccus oleiagri]
MTRDHIPHLAPATRLVASGRPERRPGAPVNPELVLSSTFVAGGDLDYARAGNPTWSAFETTLASLEGDEDTTALAFASGMAAVSAALSLLPHGGRVILPQHCYSGTSALLDTWERQGRAAVTRVDLADLDGLHAALANGTDLVWVESPTNPMLEVCDVAAVVERAHAAGALVVEDNTFNTPLGRRPLDDGVDVVVHSATKYLAGHSDVLLGATVTNDPELAAKLTQQRLLGGAIPGPFETWLTLRGMRTLHLRWERACANAAILADRLRNHARVERVRYPGPGAIIAIEVNGGAEAAMAVEDAVELWLPATSLGGVESMLERRRRHALEPASVPDNLLRLSVGVEDVDDLWLDLDRALSVVTD